MAARRRLCDWLLLAWIAEARIQFAQIARPTCVLLLVTGIAKPKAIGFPERITFCRDGTLHACFSS